MVFNAEVRKMRGEGGAGEEDVVRSPRWRGDVHGRGERLSLSRFLEPRRVRGILMGSKEGEVGEGGGRGAAVGTPLALREGRHRPLAEGGGDEARGVGGRVKVLRLVGIGFEVLPVREPQGEA